MTTTTWRENADRRDEQLDAIWESVDRSDAYMAEQGIDGILPPLVRLQEQIAQLAARASKLEAGAA